MKNILINFLKILDYSIQKDNIEIIKSVLGNKIDVYIDVGAHKGEMIDLLQKNFKINNILAFEPNPENLKLIEDKKKKNLKIFDIALGEKNKKEFLNIGHLSAMSTLNKINTNSFYTYLKKLIILIFFGKYSIYKKKILVQKKTIKYIFASFKKKSIDLIKIDTEGHEFNVLRGIGEKLFKKVKLILFEVHYDDSLIKNYSFKKIDKYLEKKGFICINKNKMLLRKGYEVIYKNQNLCK